MEIPTTINLLGTEVELLRLIITIVIIVVGFGVGRLAKALLAKYSGTHLPPDTRRNVSRFVYYGIIAITLISALGASGVDLSGVLVAGGITGIVIGFATQSLFSNLISGIFLQIDKPMKVGDSVLITGKLPEFGGVVVEISTLSTRFRMFDGTYVRLPNTEVFMSEIRNFSGSAARRIDFSVRIAYQQRITKAVDIIEACLGNQPLVLVEPEPEVYVENLGESSVNINVFCWVPFSEWFPMKMELIKLVKEELDKNGIEIPFPQRVVRFAETGRRRDIIMKSSSPSSLSNPKSS